MGKVDLSGRLVLLTKVSGYLSQFSFWLPLPVPSLVILAPNDLRLECYECFRKEWNISTHLGLFWDLLVKASRLSPRKCAGFSMQLLPSQKTTKHFRKSFTPTHAIFWSTILVCLLLHLDHVLKHLILFSIKQKSCLRKQFFSYCFGSFFIRLNPEVVEVTKQSTFNTLTNQVKAWPAGTVSPSACWPSTKGQDDQSLHMLAQCGT